MRSNVAPFLWFVAAVVFAVVWKRQDQTVYLPSLRQRRRSLPSYNDHTGRVQRLTWLLGRIP
jgi:hypothetical protein